MRTEAGDAPRERRAPPGGGARARGDGLRSEHDRRAPREALAGRDMLRLPIVLGAAIAVSADEPAPAPLLAAGADEPSFWAFYPHQRCAGGGGGAGALLQLACGDDAGGGTERQACELARACRRSRAPADCRAACLAAGGERCGGYDTRGRLFAAAACTGEFSRVAGEGDLFVRQSQPLRALLCYLCLLSGWKR